jgi:nucleotide sugar dehydrogenase
LRLCVVGLGEVGLPTGRYIASRGFETWGYDTNVIRVNEAKHCGISATADWSRIPRSNIDAYIVCVSTGVDLLSRPDGSAVWMVCKKIASRNHDDVLVSIESTVPIGTSRRIHNDIFKESADLVHVPHRFWRENPDKHGVRQLRVIGGIDEESLKRGLRIYQQLDIPLHPVSSVEMAEMSKIVENSYRFLQIAFAEELKMMCDEHKVDMLELRKACNTKWNIKILEARDGILGHCLSKDMFYLMGSSRNVRLLRSAVAVDKKYRKTIREEKRRLNVHGGNGVDSAAQKEDAELWLWQTFHARTK